MILKLLGLVPDLKFQLMIIFKCILRHSMDCILNYLEFITCLLSLHSKLKTQCNTFFHAQPGSKD